MKMTKAFTMIELIYVIVIIAVLASVALPRFAGVRTQADIGSGKSQVATIRAAIVNERQSRLITGNPGFIDKLSTGVALNGAGNNLFTGNDDVPQREILQNAIISGNNAGQWLRTGIVAGVTETYRYNTSDGNTVFTYYAVDNTVGGVVVNRAGEFSCVQAAGTGVNCNAMTR